MNLIEADGPAVRDTEDVDQLATCGPEESILKSPLHFRDDHCRQNPDQHHHDHQFYQRKTGSYSHGWTRMDTDLKAERNPHPNPLPSDGRGNRFQRYG